METPSSSVRSLELLVLELRMRGALVFRGLTALRELKAQISRATRELGIRIQWDPGSDPVLMDWLGGASVGALHGAVAGAALGLLLGALTDDIERGLLIGAVVGATGGALVGVQKVHEGWRVRVVRDEAGEPLAFVEVIQ